MLIFAIITLILNLIGICGSIFIIVSMFFNGDGNLVLYLPVVLSVVLTVFSLKGLNKMHNHAHNGVAPDKQYRRYKIFLLLNGSILFFIYLAGICVSYFPI